MISTEWRSGAACENERAGSARRQRNPKRIVICGWAAAELGSQIQIERRHSRVDGAALLGGVFSSGVARRGDVAKGASTRRVLLLGDDRRRPGHDSVLCPQRICDSLQLCCADYAQPRGGRCRVPVGPFRTPLSAVFWFFWSTSCSDRSLSRISKATTAASRSPQSHISCSSSRAGSTFRGASTR